MGIGFFDFSPLPVGTPLDGLDGASFVEVQTNVGSIRKPETQLQLIRFPDDPSASASPALPDV